MRLFFLGIYIFKDLFSGFIFIILLEYFFIYLKSWQRSKYRIIFDRTINYIYLQKCLPLHVQMFYFLSDEGFDKINRVLWSILKVYWCGISWYLNKMDRKNDPIMKNLFLIYMLRVGKSLWQQKLSLVKLVKDAVF